MKNKIQPSAAQRKTNKRTISSQKPKQPTGPGVSIRVDNKRLEVPANALINPEVREQLAARCREASDTPAFEIRKLTSWPDDARSLLLQFIASLERPCEIRHAGSDETFDNLFEAALHVAEGTANIVRCTNSQRAAVEAAALTYPDRLEPACQRIADRFRELGVRGLTVRGLLSQARNLLGNNDEQPDPRQAAIGFHNSVREAVSVSGGPALRYFQDEFYLWQRDRWARVPDREIAARLTQSLQLSRLSVTSRYLQDVLVNLRGEVVLPAWDQQLPLWVPDEQGSAAEPSPYISFRNGMVDRSHLLEAENGELDVSEHDPRHFSQVVLPYDYDPEADCPFWLQTLEEVFPQHAEGDRRTEVLQEFMGYTLMQHDTTFEKFLILHGQGANGKSTILRVWEALLGTDNVSHVALDAIGSQFGMFDMLGKLANIAADMNRMDRVQEGVLKSLTSGERMQFDRKHREPVTASPTARLVFATNNLPPITDRSEGVWRRMIAMPLNQKFDEASRDRRRAERLLEELPGIFNWAMEGARRLYAQERFSECVVCGSCLEEYMLNSDPFRQFVEEQLEFAPDAEIAKDEAYVCYRDYCGRNGYYAKSKSEFGKQMCLLDGVTAGRSGTGSRGGTYRGVKLVKREFALSSSVVLPPESPAGRRSSRGFSSVRRPAGTHSPCEAA